VYAFKTLSLIASFAMYKKNTIVLFLAWQPESGREL
jgi:hypothetical protein